MRRSPGALVARCDDDTLHGSVCDYAGAGRNGLRRTYAPGVLDTLAIISLGQSAGLSLDEIGSMFTPDGGTSIDRAFLLAKAEEIDALAKRLKAMSEGLRHAAACPAPSHAECPKFQRLLKAAASGAIERSLRM